MALSIKMLEDTVQKAAEILQCYWNKDDLAAANEILQVYRDQEDDLSLSCLALLEKIASQYANEAQAKEEIVQVMKKPVIAKLQGIVREVERKSGENYPPCLWQNPDPLQKLKEETDSYTRYLFGYYEKKGGYFRNCLWKKLMYYDPQWQDELYEEVMNGSFFQEKILRVFDPKRGMEFPHFVCQLIKYKLKDANKAIMKRIDTMNAIAKETADNFHDRKIDTDDGNADVSDDVADVEDVADDEANDDDLITLARRALENKVSDRGTFRLGYFQQRALFSHHFKGMSCKQTAEQLGSTERTVANELRGARARLNARLNNVLPRQANQKKRLGILVGIGYLLAQDEKAMEMLESCLESQSADKKLGILGQLYERITDAT